MPRNGNNIQIDTSEAKEKMRKLRFLHSEKEMKQMQARVLRSVGKKVKSIVKEKVPEEYYITPSKVGRDVRRMRMSRTGAGNAGCVIPIEGVRHIIGGKTFPAVGGRYGWTGIHRGAKNTGKRYKIYARILANSFSRLPEEMEDQGGNPPFRNIGANRLNDAAFTRSRSGPGFPPNNKPIARVTGVAVPQMVLNRSRAEIEEEIQENMMNSIDTEYDKLIERCR